MQKVTTPEGATFSERVHFERGNKKRLAGTTAIDDTLTLEAIIPNSAKDSEFYDLLQTLQSSRFGTRSLPSTYFKTITITELNEVGRPIRSHVYQDCVLNKYELPDFDATSSENAIEKLTFYVNSHVMV